VTDSDWKAMSNIAKVALTFLNAFCGILVAYPGPELSPLARVIAAAMIAGCGAALLLLNPPGGGTSLTAKQKREAVEAVRKEMMATPGRQP
jgi:hypothetical protein